MDMAKAAGALMGACALALNFVPTMLRYKLEDYIRRLFDKLFSRTDPFAYVEVPSKSPRIRSNIIYGTTTASSTVTSTDSHGLINQTNPFYEDVALYLSSLDIQFNTKRVSVYGYSDSGRDRDLHTSSDHARFVFGLPLNETLCDTFENCQLWWSHNNGHGRTNSGYSLQKTPNNDAEDHVYTLTLLAADKQRVLVQYLKHISSIAKQIRRGNTALTLYTNARHSSIWTAVEFKHPSTFDSLALEGDLAERIQADLKAFSESEDFYHRVGRSWKRGYLLYGPPGTGKSSLIAAIANFMRYDVYDLELTNVKRNSELRGLLMQTKRKCIIVIEDIDCSMNTNILEKRNKNGVDPPALDVDANDFSSWIEKGPNAYADSDENRLTLSGLLNFTDGLLSCFAEERIFIFTTNHKERLDPALLRSGRMDMHILLSYCTFPALKKLALNYLGVCHHKLYDQLEDAMKPGVKITPATIAEILISYKKDPDTAINKVLDAVREAKPLTSGDRGYFSHGEDKKSGESSLSGN